VLYRGKEVQSEPRDQALFYNHVRFAECIPDKSDSTVASACGKFLSECQWLIISVCWAADVRVRLTLRDQREPNWHELNLCRRLELQSANIDTLFVNLGRFQLLVFHMGTYGFSLGEAK